MKRFGITVITLFLVLRLTAQVVNPGADAVFRPDEVMWVFLEMDPAHKSFLQDPANALSETYFPATIRLKNTQMDTTLGLPVGVRLRGNTSRFAEKKSFKIDFREFGGPKFFDYKKFNLKANVNDPSLVREALSLEQYRELGVPAARTHHARLYINGEYMGVYLNIEQVDDVFLKMRFGHSNGYMYKCNWGASLSSPSQAQDAVLFESEINKSTDTRAEISQFIATLNATSDADFPAVIETIFEVDRYLRQLAVEALIGHWDGYSFNQNNFYLYYNSVTARVEFIPYDVDNTWGIDWIGQDWAIYDLNAWYMPGQARPLTTRILAVPAYFEKYKAYLQELIETTFNHSHVDPLLSQYQSILQFPVSVDTYFPRAFGFTYQDFLNSGSSRMNNHVEYGIKPYLDERLLSAQLQMPGLVTAVDEKKYPSFTYPNPSSLPEFRYTSETADPLAVGVYRTDGTPVPVFVSREDERTLRIVVDKATSPGIYLIRDGGKTTKWIYNP
ncbi:MAG: CotH kinase family protein [Cyclobacteriaceae bacterium]|nr:CotH kinase family protein [Cyclobacteriaceae bacterium]